MKTKILLTVLFLTACTDNNVLVGKWVYSSEKIISDLKANPKTPSKVLKCFEMKACGHNTTFEYTKTQWRQITTFQNGELFKSEYTDYEIIKFTENMVISTKVDGALLETIFTIIDKDNISYVVESDGFKWTEYLRREH